MGTTPEPLTADQLAIAAGATPEYVRRLVDAGAIHPDPDGLHAADDISRVRLAHALAEGGIEVEDLVWAIDAGVLPGWVDFAGQMWSSLESTGRTFAQFAASLGPRRDWVPAIYVAFGLAVPPPETMMRRDEEEAIADFLDLWTAVDDRPEASVRAAHIAGDGVRRIQEATQDLFDEFEGSPPQRLRRGLAPDDAFGPSLRQAPTMSHLLVWLQARHSERDIFGRIVASVESALAEAGRAQSRPGQLPAISFVDLADYTAVTAKAGDERAAHLASVLQTLAEVAAAPYRGRVVKLLGDGVMMRYSSASDAVASVRQLMTAIVDAQLPPAHAGVASGPVVMRDGDVFGHTVNLAARIAAHAAPGELLLPADVAESLRAEGIDSVDVGEAQLKGLPDPIRLARVALQPSATKRT